MGDFNLAAGDENATRAVLRGQPILASATANAGGGGGGDLRAVGNTSKLKASGDYCDGSKEVRTCAENMPTFLDLPTGYDDKSNQLHWGSLSLRDAFEDVHAHGAGVGLGTTTSGGNSKADTGHDTTGDDHGCTTKKREHGGEKKEKQGGKKKEEEEEEEEEQVGEEEEEKNVGQNELTPPDYPWSQQQRHQPGTIPAGDRCTSRNADRCSWIDYMWVSSGLSTAWLSANHTPQMPMPSQQEPSDHLPLMAGFNFKQDKDKQHMEKGVAEEKG